MTMDETSLQYYDHTTENDPSVYDDMSAFVRSRYIRMSIAKFDYSSRMQGALQLNDASQEWIVRGESFGSPVRFPTLRDVKQAVVDKLMQNAPEADILIEDKNQTDYAIAMKAYIDCIKESLHEKKVKRRCIDDMVLLGNGFRGVFHHEVQKRTGRGKVETTFNDTATYYIDPRYLFIDETVMTLHDRLELEGARDVLQMRIMPYSTFRRLFDGKPGFKNLDKVQPKNWFSDEMGGNIFLNTTFRETIEKSPVNVVKVYEYMNQETDTYGLVANGWCIFEDSLTKVKGTCRIPIVHYVFEPRRDSVWATSLAELVAPHIWLEDTLMNLEIMNLKLTLQPVLAVSGDFGFNSKTMTVQPGAVWTAGGVREGKVGDSITPVIAGNANTNFYNFYQLLQNRFSITTRTDLRNLESTEQTATQTLAQARSYNAHTEQIEQVNEVEAEGVLTELMIDVTQSFLSEKDEEGRAKIVEVTGFVVNQSQGSAPKFVQKSGAHDYFTMTQDVLDQKYTVKVIDKRSEISNQTEKLGRMMQAVTLVNNVAANSPEVREKVDWLGLVDEIFSVLDMNVEKVMKKDVVSYMDEYKMIQEEIMLGHNIDIPPEETRDESLKRMRFLTMLHYDPETKQESSFWKTLDGRGQMAWQYHFDKTLQNITANQIEKLQAQKDSMGNTSTLNQVMGEAPLGAPPVGGMAGAGVPPAGPMPQAGAAADQWSTMNSPDKGLVTANTLLP